MHAVAGTMSIEECPWWPALTRHYDRPDLRPYLPEWYAFLDEVSDCNDDSSSSGLDWSEDSADSEEF